MTPKIHDIDLIAIAQDAMIEYGFFPKFPAKVLSETRRIDDKINFLTKKERESIVDLRDYVWSSIDNVDSKDLDQVEYCEPLSNGAIRVFVAIADVDSYVSKQSVIDKHASKNATSVYTGVVVFPMLPEKLSNNLSSLNPDEDRLAVVKEFIVHPDGEVQAEKVYRALIRNKAKLVYEEIGDWLEGKSATPKCVSSINGLEEQLRLQDEAAQRLRRYREEKGALELETIEASPLMDEHHVKDIVIKHKNRARYLIENFMIAANMTMVHFLGRHGVPHIQRIVRTPERWPRICQVASTYGYSLPLEPDAPSLMKFLAQQKEKNPDQFPDLSLTIVKLIGRGEYVLTEPDKEREGHFGLAIQDYTHCTAPNRRYVDIIIQRLLKSTLSGEKPAYDKRELHVWAQWCTDRDAASKKVERFMRKVAAAMLLRGRIGEIFDGIITGASDKGTYVRLMRPPVEGRIIEGTEGLDVGEHVLVRLTRMVPEKGFIDFECLRHKSVIINQKEKGRRRRFYDKKNQHKEYRNY
jgi:exoribonuclease-2